MVMGLIRSQNFWIGVGVGALVVPVVMSRVAPGLKAKLPAQSSLT